MSRRSYRHPATAWMPLLGLAAGTLYWWFRRSRHRVDPYEAWWQARAAARASADGATAPMK